MGWRWHKSFGRGPLRLNLSQRGVGWSFGIPGLRYGRSPSGQPFVSLGIPGTGLYWIKYLRRSVVPPSPQPPLSTSTPPPVTTQLPASPHSKPAKVDRWWEDHD
jgi:hypothetical protein